MQAERLFFTTRDRLKIRYGLWPPAPGCFRGTVVHAAGRAEFLEKNAETIYRLHRMGFAVYAFDWRGQGLSSRMLKNRHKGFVATFDDYINDLDQFARQIVSPDRPGTKILLAHSMGGNIGLQYLHRAPEVFDRAVMVSPMFGINTFPLPRKWARILAAKAVDAGFSDRYIPGAGDYRTAGHCFAGNALTSDPKRFFDEHREIRENPDLALGGVTFGWLNAAFDAIERIDSQGFAEAVDTPILLVSGSRDRVVDQKAHARICRRLPFCRFLQIRDARHEILKETDSLQRVFWQAFERFTGA